MYRLSVNIYTCNDCENEWIDSKQQGFEDMSYKYCGCGKCKSKNVSWKPKPQDEIVKNLRNERGSVSKLGKPSKDFVDILTRIKSHHQGYKKNKSSINLDW